MKKIRVWLVSVVSAITLVAGMLFVLTPAPAYAVQSPPGGSPPGGPNICNGGTNCQNFLDRYLQPFIVLLSALVGVLAVISIIVAGIQYSASADDPGAVTKAKQRIFNTVLGLIGYIFLFAFLDYLVPGGIL